MSAARTYWNGEPCEARRVTVVVADDGRFPAYWARHLVGQRRDAVEVTYAGSTFYLDDEGYETSEAEAAVLRRYGRDVPGRTGFPGWGWAKVTDGRGSPRFGSASLTIEPDSVADRTALAAEREVATCEHVREWARENGKELRFPPPSCPWCGDEETPIPPEEGSTDVPER